MWQIDDDADVMMATAKCKRKRKVPPLNNLFDQAVK